MWRHSNWFIRTGILSAILMISFVLSPSAFGQNYEFEFDTYDDNYSGDPVPIMHGTIAVPIGRMVQIIKPGTDTLLEAPQTGATTAGMPGTGNILSSTFAVGMYTAVDGTFDAYLIGNAAATLPSQIQTGSRFWCRVWFDVTNGSSYGTANFGGKQYCDGGPFICPTSTSNPHGYGPQIGNVQVLPSSASPNWRTLLGAAFSITIGGIANPATNNFSFVSLGSTKRTPVVITNSGYTPLTLTGTFIPAGSAFSWSQALPVSIAANSSQNDTLIFAPTLAGVVTDTLRITHNGTGSPYNCLLSGTGRAITITRPNGSEVFITGTTDTLRWNSWGLTGSVRIELNRNYPSLTWETISSSTLNDGIEPWLVSGAASPTARIRVISVDSAAIGDTSEANFSIQTPMTLLRPGSGVTFVSGISDSIKWISGYTSGTVTIKLNRSFPTGAWSTLSSTTPITQGYFVWNPTLPPTDNARIAVVSNTYSNAADTAHGNFTIRARLITIIHENGGEVIPLNVPDTIQWNSNYATNISIAFSPNGQAYDSLITLTDSLTILGGVGSFVWTPSGNGTNHARLWIYDNTYGSEYWSAGDFTTVSTNLSVSGSPVRFSGTRPLNTDSLFISIKHPQGFSFNYLTLSGANSGAFSRQVLDTDSITTAGDSLRMRIRFTPDSTLTYLDTIRITFPAPYYPVIIPVSGLGLGYYDSVRFFGRRTFRSVEPSDTLISSFTRDTLYFSIRVFGSDSLRTDSLRLQVKPDSSSFECIYPSRRIGNGDSLIVGLIFKPTHVGNYSDTVLVSCPSLNGTLRLPFSAQSSMVLLAPSGISVTTNSSDATIRWNRVTHSVNNVPMTPQRYLVFYCGAVTIPSGVYADSMYYFLGATTGSLDTTYIHANVVTYRPYMFYKARAYTGSTDSFDSIIRTIPVGTPVTEVMTRLRESGNR